MKLLDKIPFLRNFARDEDGNMSVETVLVFPVLCWAFLAAFVYWDAFRVESTTTKAAYTISDQLSRETGYITPTYLNSVYRLHEFLTTSEVDTKLTVSVVHFDSETQDYRVRWSQERGGATLLTDGNLSSIKHRLPAIPQDEVVLVVQSWLTHEPIFNVGLTAFDFKNVVVTRPRFNSAQVCWNSSESGSAETATC